MKNCGWKLKNCGWKQNLYAAPGIGLSMLPKIAWPACWPTYAGLLSSIGLGFLIPNRVYLLPVTAAFLVVAVGTLAVGARRKARVCAAACGHDRGGLDSGRQIFIGIQPDFLRRIGRAGLDFRLE